MKKDFMLKQLQVYIVTKIALKAQRSAAIIQFMFTNFLHIIIYNILTYNSSNIQSLILGHIMIGYSTSNLRPYNDRLFNVYA